jgi:heptaprenyl diphosphate synthase
MTTFWKDYPQIEDDLLKVKEIIKNSIASGNTGLEEGLDQLISRDGKLLRPGLVLLAAYQVNKSFKETLPEKIYYIGAAVEILHMATLIHDDIIDESDTRRGEITLHKVYGIKNSVLMGDFLFSRCFSLVSDYASMENAKNLSKTVEKICDSEVTAGQKSMNLGLRDYLKRIAGKTAALIMMSLHVGCTETGGSDETLNRLHRIGYDIGMAFQIIDDILDVAGTKNKTGKPVGGDLLQGVASLPIIYAVRNGNGALETVLRHGISNKKQLKSALKLLRMSRGVDSARRRAKKYTAHAKKEISLLPDSEAKPIFNDLVNKLLEREY